MQFRMLLPVISRLFVSVQEEVPDFLREVLSESGLESIREGEILSVKHLKRVYRELPILVF
tara:strand:- start:948 stop:1130 length:183 start_codon:yes stop_codon:yes gene_type:complete